MKRMAILISTLFASLILVTASLAAGEGKGWERSEKSTTMSAPAQSGSTLSANHLVGMNVVDQAGKNIGEIQDLMLNRETGAIDYFIISKGGIMGIGGDRHAVPFPAFQINAQENQVALTIDANKLDNAPQRQAGMSDEEFSRKIYQYYGLSPAWEQRGRTQQMMEKEKKWGEERSY